jgi:hypothetical protein
VNLLRVFPAKAVVFSSNDAYRHLFSRLSMPSSSSTAGHRFSASPPPLSAGMSFLAGGCAGMTASAVTYPLDFARGRISGKLGIGGQKAYGGIVQTIVLTVKDEGFLALYKGVTPTLMVRVSLEDQCTEGLSIASSQRSRRASACRVSLGLTNLPLRKTRGPCRTKGSSLGR